MGFGEAISTCFRKYATFRGRARRSEFWYYYLFIVIINAVLGSIFGAAAGASFANNCYANDTGIRCDASGLNTFGTIMLIVLIVWSLFIILPTISVQVRRLHDGDRSGGWWWIGLIPIAGIIILIVFWAAEGTRAPNRFGPDPKSA